MLSDTAKGFRVIAAEGSLVAILAVTLIFNFFGFAYTSMVPVIGREALQVDAFAIGVLASTEAAASLAASVLWAVLGATSGSWRHQLGRRSRFHVGRGGIRPFTPAIGCVFSRWR